MTVEEKRKVLDEYCRDNGKCRVKCALLGGKWEHRTVFGCLDIEEANEEELDRVLALINGNTGAEFIGCEYCKHDDKKPDEQPCIQCKHSKARDTVEYMTAPELYEPLGTYAACAVLPVREAEGLKSTAAVIQLEVKDNSPMQIAYAIRNYIWNYYEDKYEIALIALDELTEHIDAYVRAERKALEYKKLTEEG